MQKFQRVKVPGSESSTQWYVRSWERKYVGMKVPVTSGLDWTPTEEKFYKSDHQRCLPLKRKLAVTGLSVAAFMSQ